MLLEQGSDINAKSCEGQTVLHIAIENKFHKLADLLIDYGIDIDSHTYTEHYTALHTAVYNRDLKSISLLVRRGAEVNIKDHLGITALHGMAFNDFTEECTFLIEHGANVNAKDNNGRCPLDRAVIFSQQAIVSLFLNHHSTVYSSEYLDDLLKLAIDVLIDREHYYLKQEAIAVINLLVEAGADATDIQLSEDLERRLSLRDKCNVSSRRSLLLMKESRKLDVSSSMVDNNTEETDLENGCLREFSRGPKSQQEGKCMNTER